MRAMAERFGGIDARRALPEFHRETLQRWFARRTPMRPTNGSARRGPVIFLADSFTSYTEPEIGRAAIELLEMAGWEVQLAGDVCCGRSLISKGLLDEARQRHAQLIAELAPAAAKGVPIVGCEPSCVFTLKDELPRSGARRRARVGDRAARHEWSTTCSPQAIDDGELALDPNAPSAGRSILFHGHCHQKASSATAGSVALLRRIPGATVDVLDAGCCGMAGSFGFEREHYDLSLEIGGMRLFPAVNAAPTPSSPRPACRAASRLRRAPHGAPCIRSCCFVSRSREASQGAALLAESAVETLNHASVP